MHEWVHACDGLCLASRLRPLLLRMAISMPINISLPIRGMGRKQSEGLGSQWRNVAIGGEGVQHAIQQQSHLSHHGDGHHYIKFNKHYAHCRWIRNYFWLESICRVVSTVLHRASLHHLPDQCDWCGAHQLERALLRPNSFLPIRKLEEYGGWRRYWYVGYI